MTIWVNELYFIQEIHLFLHWYHNDNIRGLLPDMAFVFKCGPSSCYHRYNYQTSVFGSWGLFHKHAHKVIALRGNSDWLRKKDWPHPRISWVTHQPIRHDPFIYYCMVLSSASEKSTKLWQNLYSNALRNLIEM